MIDARILHEKSREYRDDGVTCLRGAFDRSWVERLNRAATAWAASDRVKAYGVEEGSGAGKFLSAVFLWTQDPDFRVFTFESPAAELAGAVMGSRHVHLFKDHLFVKEGGGAAATPWHQDLPYWCVAGEQVCSLWLALEPVDQENGAVRFVRGSHRWNQVFDIEDFGGVDTQRKAGLEKVPDVDADPARYDIVSYDMDPGDCIVFHALTLHGARKNASNRRRAGHSIRFGGDDAVYNPHPAASKMFMDPGIAAGAPLGGPAFPLLWRAETGVRRPRRRARAG